MVDEKTDARVEKANVALEKKDLLAFLRYSLLDVLQFALNYTYKMGESDKRERPLDFYGATGCAYVSIACPLRRPRRLTPFVRSLMLALSFVRASVDVRFDDAAHRVVPFALPRTHARPMRGDVARLRDCGFLFFMPIRKRWHLMSLRFLRLDDQLPDNCDVAVYK